MTLNFTQNFPDKQSIRDYLKQKGWTHLHQITKDYALAIALGVNTQSYTELKKTLVDNGFISPQMPLDYKNQKINPYLKKDIVGEEAFKDNVRIRLKQNGWTHLHQITRDYALAIALGVNGKNGLELKTVLVNGKFISPQMPLDYKNRAPKENLYLNKDIVGQEAFKDNVRIRLKQNGWTHLHDINTDLSLGTALGVNGKNGLELKTVLVNGEFISPQMPLDYKNNWGEKNPYLNKDIVGEEAFKDNVRVRLKQNGWTHLHQITKDYALGTALGVKGDSPIELRKALVEIGFFTEEKSALNIFEKNLPKVFQHKKISHKKSVKLEEVLKETNYNQRIKFMKGEAFEQILGLYLSYINPKELILPQYCLNVDVNKGYFGLRVDFKVGNILYEAKWGRANENIKETHKKHNEFIKDNEDLEYKIVTHEEADDELELETETFENMTASLEKKTVREYFLKLDQIISNLANDTSKESYELLETITNYTRTLIYQANEINDENKRKQQLEIKLEELVFFIENERKSEVIKYLNNNANNLYSSLTANFEFEGKLYQSLISIPEYTQEAKNKLEEISENDKRKLMYLEKVKIIEKLNGFFSDSQSGIFIGEYSPKSNILILNNNEKRIAYQINSRNAQNLIRKQIQRGIIREGSVNKYLNQNPISI